MIKNDTVRIQALVHRGVNSRSGREASLQGTRRCIRRHGRGAYKKVDRFDDSGQFDREEGGLSDRPEYRPDPRYTHRHSGHNQNATSVGMEKSTSSIPTDKIISSYIVQTKSLVCGN